MKTAPTPRPLPELSPKHISRFRKMVVEGRASDCWLWRGSVTYRGYGQMRVGDSIFYTHRIAYAIANGDAGQRLICHHCDVPSCCNPSHLFPGTTKDNQADKAIKGRAIKKLSHEQVVEILSSNKSFRQLVEDFHISYAMVWKIKHRRTHTYLKPRKLTPQLKAA